MAEDQNRTYDAQYLLRLPSDLRDRIKEAASTNTRSMNAEIVATLEEAYPAPVEEDQVTLGELIKTIRAKLSAKYANQPEVLKDLLTEVDLVEKSINSTIIDHLGGSIDADEQPDIASKLFQLMFDAEIISS